MTKLQVGKLAPNFELPASSGENVSLSDYRGQNVVLYFYPKDMTTTCIQQSCDFRDANKELGHHNTVILGISGDTVKSHQRFIEKKELSFLLLADTERTVCEQYGVWQLKKLYGKEYMGIVRSTFLIDAAGKLVREWRKVKVKGHTQEVLDAVLQMESAASSLPSSKTRL